MLIHLVYQSHRIVLNEYWIQLQIRTTTLCLTYTEQKKILLVQHISLQYERRILHIDVISEQLTLILI